MSLTCLPVFTLPYSISRTVVSFVYWRQSRAIYPRRIRNLHSGIARADNYVCYQAFISRQASAPALCSPAVSLLSIIQETVLGERPASSRPTQGSFLAFFVCFSSVFIRYRVLASNLSFGGFYPNPRRSFAVQYTLSWQVRRDDQVRTQLLILQQFSSEVHSTSI